jgi:hypothetical protein
MSNPDDLLTVSEIAERLDIATGTWRSYVARGYAPRPDDPDDGRPANRRSPRWLVSTVDHFAANRIGQGKRPSAVSDTEAPSIA